MKIKTDNFTLRITLTWFGFFLHVFNFTFYLAFGRDQDKYTHGPSTGVYQRESRGKDEH